MRLYEIEGKELFRHYGIRVPKGKACHSLENIESCLEGLEMPVMVKAQVLAGGRGKAGGVVTAMTVDEAIAEARNIFNIQVKGLPVHSLLLEEMVRGDQRGGLSRHHHRSETRRALAYRQRTWGDRHRERPRQADTDLVIVSLRRHTGLCRSGGVSFSRHGTITGAAAGHANRVAVEPLSGQGL